MDQLEEMKAGAKVMWAAGDYDGVAQKVWSVGGELVERVGVEADDDVLDVACGTGNVATRAAATGATVTGLDLTPELLEIARARAEEGDLRIEFVEGDAEELPFADESFDVVLSTFGCMFAPRHDVVAAEMTRVIRSGGRLGICSWTPEGLVGEFFRIVASHMPPPPGPPPIEWGSEATAERLLAGAFELEVERRMVAFKFESLDATIDFYVSKFGPLVLARQELEDDGRWDELVARLRDSYDRANVATDGTVAASAEYLMVTGRRR